MNAELGFDQCFTNVPSFPLTHKYDVPILLYRISLFSTYAVKIVTCNYEKF